MYEINDAGRLVPILTSEGPRPHRRQELPPAYALNGAVFVARSEWMKSGHDWIAQDTAGYLMPDDRSIDIDTELDFALAEAVMARQSS
jgi:CMP-N,N'-diacetyllegionaminic acid synthase